MLHTPRRRRVHKILGTPLRQVESPINRPMSADGKESNIIEKPYREVEFVCPFGPRWSTIYNGYDFWINEMIRSAIG